MGRDEPARRVCKVLVVEDDRSIQQMLEDVFDDEGYGFLCVSSAEEFRRALAEEPELDIAIVDVILPGDRDGFALAQEAADRGLAVVLSTGHHDYFERLERSGHHYLLKPYRIAALLDVVKMALEAARRRCLRKPDERTRPTPL